MAQGVEAKVKLSSAINQLGEILNTLRKVLFRDPKRFVVHKDQDILKVTIIDYKDILEAHFFNPDIAVNMVSATLSFQGQFFYPLKTLFLDKILSIRPSLLGKVYAPVFDKKQAEFITPMNLVDYRDEKYEKQLAHIAKTLVAKNNGSALLLFTSIKRMRSIYDVLLAEDLPYTLLIPDENTSKLDLIHKFKKDVSSVLFGSYSFWEGIDVPGDSLTLIIIDKLPFETPTELSKALSEQFGGFQYQCYKTTLKLKQGIGRLIRSETDMGKIIICDNRLHNTSWGKLIYKNLQ
jgi:ATP-dependent DNA helicase DinG